MNTTINDARRAGRAMGALFFSIFGGVWLGGWALRSGASVPTDIVIAVLTLALTGLAYATYRRYAPALAALARAAYTLLGLQSFFTAGPKEIRAWTIPAARMYWTPTVCCVHPTA